MARFGELGTSDPVGGGISGLLMADEKEAGGQLTTLGTGTDLARS